MFDQVQVAPPDSILGITEAFKKDPNPNKINLSVGVYKDAAGKTPVLKTVKAAEELLLRGENSKDYVPIDGTPQFAAVVQGLMFGADKAALAGRFASTSHTPGGTGALRVAGDYLRKMHPKACVWISDPTWPNHPQIFQAAGLTTRTYPYFDAAGNALALDKMLAGLEQVQPGDVVLLHGCCHNPTGIDPAPEQWRRIAAVLVRRQALPLVDFAYQGFGDGLKEDAAGLWALLEQAPEMLVCSSFSKNFGLYNERVGALTVVAAGAAAAAAVQSQVKTCIRANYSNPPAHGAAIVSTILADAGLRREWEGELKTMRERIQSMRQTFVQTLAAKGVKRDMSFIARQRGMFSFSGLNKEHVEALKQKHSIYIVGNGRINVAGITPGNMETLCGAIAGVMD